VAARTDSDAAIIRGVLRLVGGISGVALLCAAVAVAAAGPPNLANGLKTFKRAHRAYDVLPKAAAALGPNVTVSRRVATAVDKKKHSYYVYVTQTKDKSACIVLVQGNAYTSHCRPVGLLFEQGQETVSAAHGLIGGVAQNDVKKIVLAGGSKKMTIPLTPDNGYLWGCPAPTNCAKWVRTVIGYNAAGKIVSRESVQ
jgi:hypothetical protein